MADENKSDVPILCGGLAFLPMSCLCLEVYQLRSRHNGSTISLLHGVCIVVGIAGTLVLRLDMYLTLCLHGKLPINM